MLITNLQEPKMLGNNNLKLDIIQRMQKNQCQQKFFQ
jgi:hypothetical protein